MNRCIGVAAADVLLHSSAIAHQIEEVLSVGLWVCDPEALGFLYCRVSPAFVVPPPVDLDVVDADQLPFVVSESSVTVAVSTENCT